MKGMIWDGSVVPIYSVDVHIANHRCINFWLPCWVSVAQNWTVHGLYWGSHRLHQPDVFINSIKEPLSWLAKGAIKVNISHTFTLQEVRLKLVAL